ncbi:MAG: PorV/PorQ family protein [bacterium]
MKLLNTSFSIVFVGLFLFPVSAKSQSPVGFDFLRTQVGARPSAMAGAFIAIPGDIHNLVYNPAGLSAITKRQGTASYLNHLLDFQSGFFAYAQPIAQGTGAVAVNFFDFGQFERSDVNNVVTGEFGANSLVFSVSYSQEVVQNLSLGGSAKFIRFQIDDLNETALAADIGLMFTIPDEDLNFGVGVFNVGTTTSAFIDTKDDLPLSVQVGASKTLEHLPLLISASLVKVKEDDLRFRLGGEITFTEQFFGRLGYNSVGQDQKVNTGKDRLAGVSAGLGFKVGKFNVDYSFSSFGEIGSLNRVTLIGQF